MMIAHLVYSDGRRELYSRTVADESQPKIVEVGSSLPIQQEKTLMTENSPQVEKRSEMLLCRRAVFHKLVIPIRRSMSFLG